MDHPSVQLKLPLDGKAHSVEIPQETTLFFWGAVAPGTADRLCHRDSEQGYCQRQVTRDLSERASWTVSLPEEEKPLLDEVYREEGYNGRAWWVACDPIALPTTVEVTFDSAGECPKIEGEPVVLWTENGESIEWGGTIESTIELVPSSTPATQFPTRQEHLWDRHTVYVPNWEPATTEPHISSR